MNGPIYTTQPSVQLFAATIGGNESNAELSGWWFLIGSRQRLLQPIVSKVAQCQATFRVFLKRMSILYSLSN